MVNPRYPHPHTVTFTLTLSHSHTTSREPSSVSAKPAPEEMQGSLEDTGVTQLNPIKVDIKYVLYNTPSHIHTITFTLIPSHPHTITGHWRLLQKILLSSRRQRV